MILGTETCGSMGAYLVRSHIKTASIDPMGLQEACRRTWHPASYFLETAWLRGLSGLRCQFSNIMLLYCMSLRPGLSSLSTASCSS